MEHRKYENIRAFREESRSESCRRVRDLATWVEIDQNSAEPRPRVLHESDRCVRIRHGRPRHELDADRKPVAGGPRLRTSSRMRRWL